MKLASIGSARQGDRIRFYGDVECADATRFQITFDVGPVFDLRVDRALRFPKLHR